MADWIYPFHDTNNGEYHYFSFEQITKSVHVTQYIYDEALSLVKSKKAWIESADFGYATWGYEKGLIGEIIVAFPRKNFIKVSFNRDTLLHCQCNEYGCKRGKKGGCCVHEAAALILVQNYLVEHRPGDSTDRDAAIFLEYFHSTQQTNQELKQTVQLLPKISPDGSELSLRLAIFSERIGKSYIVKKIPDLFEAVQEGEIYPLGKNNEIDFSQEGFTEKSRAFAQMILGWMDEKRRRSRGFWYDSGEYDDLKSSVRLYGERTDHFFDLFEGEKVEYNYERKNTTLTLKNSQAQIHLQITKLMGKENKFEGITVSGKIPQIFYGNQYAYYIENGCLCRMGKDSVHQISPLLSLSRTEDNEIQFHIGRKNLSEFYYTILPTLKESVTIEENDTDIIEQFLPPEVFFRFYLDVDNGRPECRVETRYGEIGVAIFDLLESSILKEDFRDAQRESIVLDTVMQYFPEFRRWEERFLGSADEEAVYDIVENAVPKLMEFGEIVCTDRFQNIQIKRKLKISVGVSIDSDLLNLQIITDNLSQKELLDIIKSYRQHKKYHRLKSGEFVDLDDSIAELSAMLDTMHISPKEFVNGKMQMPVYRALYLDKMLEQSQEIYAKRDSHYKQLIKNFKTVTESDFEIPESLQNVMRGYQRFGHKWLRTVGNCGFGGILADDMGLGKTLQMISVLLAEKEEGKQGTSLIICPASLIFNWAAEFEKFAPQLNICTVSGTQKDRATLIQDYQNYDVLITSYDFIKRDIANYEDCEFSCQVLDEAQYIKNHTTAAAKSVKLIRAKRKFALTGTPIENRLSELWSIFDYLMPSFLYGYETFKKEFETPIVKKSDQEAMKRLRRMTSPFILRRLKQDVLRDLPDKLEEDYIVRLDEEQRHIYDAKVLELRQMLEGESAEGYQSDKLKIFAYLTQIRQICCDPALLYENYTGESAKTNACMEIVQRAIEGEHRMLIFSQFTTMLERLEIALKEQNIPYFKITGETSKKKRLELVEKFNSGDTPVFLISLKAGGTGLNLTGADVVVHYDPWWNVAAQNQATDRTHRIGQTKTVTVYKLIAKHTIEEKIQQMQQKKSSLAESILTGEFVNLSSLSKEELLEILQ